MKNLGKVVEYLRIGRNKYGSFLEILAFIEDIESLLDFVHIFINEKLFDFVVSLAMRRELLWWRI